MSNEKNTVVVLGYKGDQKLPSYMDCWIVNQRNPYVYI